MLTRRATLAGLAALALPLAAHAQGFPSRTITIVVPYPPGGPIDALARLIAQEAAADLGQSIVVENRPGGSGIIGTNAVARAEPDGHMLVLGTNQTHATNQSLIKNCPYDAVQGFRAGRRHRRHAARAGGAQEPRRRERRRGRRDGEGQARAASPSARSATAPARISRANCSRPRPASTCCTCRSRACRPCSPSCWPAAST